MPNISDFYYVVQFIVHQIFIYLRDLLFRKYYGHTNENDAEGKKSSSSSLKQFVMDFFALSLICALSFLLAVFSSKYTEKKPRDFRMPNIETIAVDLEDDALSADGSRKSSKTSLQDYSDSTNYQSIPLKNMSVIDCSEKQSCAEYLRPRKPFSCYSQCTQTQENVSHRTTYKCWLVRRTRSGQIYGKYPL